MGIEYEAWGRILARIKEIEDKLDASIRSYFDPFEDAVASPVASEHWTGEVFTGSAEDSDADINTTVSGKAYVIANPDAASPAATGYWLRKNNTINASFFTVIVDADFTWGTAAAGNLDGGIWITKGAAYDANNHFYLVRRKSTTGPLNNITIDGVLNSVGLTAATASVTDDAVAFKIERWHDQWRFYYSLSKSPDYTWVFIDYFEDTSNYMTDEVSIALGANSPGSADAESVRVDFDNYKFYVNTNYLSQILSEGYNSTHILANKNGSILEQLKYMTGKLATIDTGGGGGEGAQTGDVYYVHTGGSDSNPGSYAEPFLTIDYAISQCTANQDDTIVVMASATQYDENANTNGVIVDVAGITIVGEGNEKDDSVQVINSNGAATSVFDVTAANCHIHNIAIVETTATVEGIVGAGNEVHVKGCRFDGLMENAIHLTGHDNLIENNYLHDMTNDGIELEGDRNLVRWNEIVDCGDNGISAIAGSDDNIIAFNVINGVADTTNGLNIAGDDNFCPGNEIANCVTASVVDTGSRNFFGETSTGGTVRQFNTSLYDMLGGANGFPVYPAAANPGNGISLAEVCRAIVNSLMGDDDFDNWTDVNNTAAPIASLDAVLQRYFSVVGCDGTNVFNPTIFGSVRTTFETAFNTLATYFSPSAAAWSVQMNNATADASLEETWEEWTTVVGVNGTNQLTNINNSANLTFNAVFQKFAALWGADTTNVFEPTIFGATRATLEAALQNLALYFSVSSAAWSVQMNNATADASLEDTWEEWTRVVGVNGTNQFTNINNSANLTMDTIFQKFAALWGADSTNVFSVTIGGTAYTNLETVLQGISDQIAGEDTEDAKTGATYYVSTAGNDGNPGTLYSPFLTIDYAISQCTANNDDQIIILPGAYDESANTGGVIVDVAGVTIRGVQPTADQQVTTVVNSNVGATAVFTVSVNNVTIQNLAIIETTATVEGIVSTGSYCIFEGLQLFGAMENGIHLSAATQNTIRDCTIFGMTNDGIEISGASVHNIIESTLIGVATDNGIHFNGDGADENVVRDVEILGGGTTTNGIHLNGADENMINDKTEITGCTVGVLIAAGSNSNTISANITSTTDVTDNSGVATNTLNGSLTNLHHETRHIPKFSGEIWYVDGTGGLDTNSGLTPETSFATIGAAISAASAGDRIYVKATAAKYDENGLDMNLQGLELFFEEGAILEDSTPGTVLTISANDCHLVNVFIDNDDNGGVGFDATTAASVWMEHCTAMQCTVGFNLDGVKGRFDDCVAIDNSTTGFDIQTTQAVFRNCVANGNSAAVRGFYLSDNTADLNTFINCHTVGNTTAGWETVAGADNNTFTRCSSASTDGIRVDAGTNNSWPGMLEGTDLPIDKSTYDIIGTNYVDGGGAFNLDSIGDDFNTLGTYIIDGTAGNEAGTTLGAGKSIIDALGTDGSDTLSHDFSEAGLMQFMHGYHQEAIILFIIPDAVASITADNTAIQTELAKLGEVITITDDDALTYPDYLGVTLIVTGTDKTNAWNTANLAHAKTIPDVPIICCDVTAAAYFEIGTDGGDAAAKTVINAVANIEGSILGTGFHDVVGLAAGANTVSSSTTYNTLDMSDADVTETWYAYETANANTDVVLGEVRQIQMDGSSGVDEDGNEIAKTIGFYGCAYSAGDLNTLGLAVLRLFCERMIHERTVGFIEDGGASAQLMQKIFGNQRTSFTNTAPMVEYLAGQNSEGTKLPVGMSLYDMVFKSESPQTGTITLTAQNTWYSVFTAYTSTDYTVEGTVSLDFPINQTYEVRITRHAAGRNPGAVSTYVIGATAESRTFLIGPTQYLDVEARCTTAAGIIPTWDRVLKYAKDTGAIAPT